MSFHSEQEEFWAKTYADDTKDCPESARTHNIPPLLKCQIGFIFFYRDRI